VKQNRKAEWKEQMLNILQHPNKHSLFLRITFWINKMVKLIYRPKRETEDHECLNFELQGVQKMQLKSIVIFLRYMQDLVERLINLRVSTNHDFEW
jgi:hypothetical protein